MHHIKPLATKVFDNAGIFILYFNNCLKSAVYPTHKILILIFEKVVRYKSGMKKTPWKRRDTSYGIK